MEKLHTVYGIQNAKLIPGFSVFFLFIVVLGIIIFFYNKFNGDPDDVNSWGINKRKFAMYFGLAFSLFALSLFGAVISTRLQGYCIAKDFFDKGKFKTIEGVVKNHHPMSEEGGNKEQFDVDGVHFEFSDHDKSGYGYNTSASHGGAIKKDLFVQIVYITVDGNNEILKLKTE